MSKKHPVETTHPDYKYHSDDWDLIEDCIAGEKAIKAKGKIYLPSNLVSDAQYKVYLSKASFTPYAEATLEYLMGCVFRKPPEIILPQNLLYLNDGKVSTLPLEQIIRNTTRGVLKQARYALLVDMPDVPQQRTLLDDMQGKYKPQILCYPAQSIINWRDDESLIVLREQYTVDKDDGFGIDRKYQYRELRLEDGYYIQRLWREGEVVAVYEPRDANGNRLTVIPIQFVGSRDNTPSVDKSPILGMAQKNIKIYQDDADIQRVNHLYANPTVVVKTSLNYDNFLLANGGKPADPQNGTPAEHVEPEFGTGKGYFLGPDGDIKLTYLPPDQLVFAVQDRKINELIAIGGKIITPSVHNTTATEINHKHRGEVSILDQCVGNITLAINTVLQYVCMFTGDSPEKVYVDVNRDYYDTPLDPQVLMLQLQNLQNGAIGMTDYRNLLRKRGLIEADRSDTDIDQDTAHSVGGFELE
ncbi:DUF4055 domain-containing protein [Marinobacter nauticus]|uniref:DUF4055 domain-containing protein n=1 Tax=Marinobacter nauticus TaxID=2743 RepID=UPI001C99C807|nr:DUF4055 domain-containing protein [Marinobacter nauticus]MBY5962111.1 DUF4055 domain-containing protein [Marinobacter nauticus]